MRINSESKRRLGSRTGAQNSVSKMIIIHLLCAAPINREVFHRGPIEVVEDLVIVPDVEVQYRPSRPICRATLEPQGSELTFTVMDGDISLFLDRVGGHRMIVLHYA
jgi:hypothetical protein